MGHPLLTFITTYKIKRESRSTYLSKDCLDFYFGYDCKNFLHFKNIERSLVISS